MDAQSTAYNEGGSEALRKIEKFARLLDSQFKLPGTNFRFGLDPILGLIPFVGDATSLGIQLGLLSAMMQYGASRKVIILMTLNLLLDFTIGSIPFIGGVFDFFYKSSERNLRLLKRHYGEGKYQGKGTGIIILVIVIILAVFALIGFLMYKLIAWIIGFF